MLWIIAFRSVVPAAEGASPAEYRVTIDLGEQIQRLGSDDLFEQEEASARLLAVGSAALPALDAALLWEPPPVRAAVVGLLPEIGGDAALSLLVRAAGDADRSVREEALLALGRTGDERARGVVEAALANPDVEIARAASFACAGVCGTPEALRRLVILALADQPPARMGVQRQSLREIGRRGSALAQEVGRAVRTTAGPVLEDGELSLERRLRAALLFADLADPTGSPVLYEGLAHAQNRYLRLQTVGAIARVGDEAAVGGLRPLVADHDPVTRSLACAVVQDLAAREVRGAETVAVQCTDRQKPPGTAAPDG